MILSTCVFERTGEGGASSGKAEKLNAENEGRTLGLNLSRGFSSAPVSPRQGPFSL